MYNGDQSEIPFTRALEHADSFYKNRGTCKTTIHIKVLNYLQLRSIKRNNYNRNFIQTGVCSITAR